MTGNRWNAQQIDSRIFWGQYESSLEDGTGGFTRHNFRTAEDAQEEIITPRYASRSYLSYALTSHASTGSIAINLLLWGT